MNKNTFYNSRSVTLLFYAFLTSVSYLLFYIIYTRYVNFSLREIGDSATYMQVSWSILHSTPFTTSIHEHLVGNTLYNFLGDQLIFILALIAPFLEITESGIVFLIAQITIIFVGTALLYHYAANTLNNRLISMLIAIAFVFNNATLSTFIDFGFRAETFFIPIIFALFYFLLAKKTAAALLMLALFLLTKHNSIPVIFLLGLFFILLEKEKRKFGIYCVFMSVAYYFIAVKGIMGSLQTNPLAYFKHFSQFGDTPTEAISYMVTNPTAVISLLSMKEAEHMVEILFPMGFLSLATPVFWVASPQILMNIVLTDYHSIFAGWHWAIVIPFVFIGITRSASYLLMHFKSPYVHYALYITLLLQISVSANAFINDNITYMESYPAAYSAEHSYKIDRIMSQVPSDASLMVSAQLLWQAYNRENVFISNIKFHEEVDFIAILLPLGNDAHYNGQDKHLTIEANLLNTNKPSKFDQFNIVYRDSNLILFRNKDYKKQPCQTYRASC